MIDRDWRLPQHRVEAFQRFYTFHLKYKSHPGCVYGLFPEMVKHFDLDRDGRAWLTWINGNTQNAVTSFLLLEAAPTHHDWMDAIEFWNTNFKRLEWDTDRRHQKSKFGEATAKWYAAYGDHPAERWDEASAGGWDTAWAFSKGQPWMGRLSAWSMLEYARILLGRNVVPDAGSWLLEDVSGSQSHRNGLAFLRGYDSVYWTDEPFMLDIVDDLSEFGDELLRDARERNPTEPDVSRLTMESALCTYKSWHKPNRRYPNVYSDMMYNRIKKAETRFDRDLWFFWDARAKHLPEHLRLEDNPFDPGLAPVKQNHYLETGEPIMLQEMGIPNSFQDNVDLGVYGKRKDPSWAI